MKTNKGPVSRFFAYLLTSITFAFLYVPIIVLLVFSFNTKRFPSAWDSFTLKWYKKLFNSEELWSSFFTSLTVSLITTFLCLLLSLLLLYFRANGGKIKKAIPLFYGNLVIPESLFAISLLSYFTFFDIPLGFTTLIVAHTVLSLGFAIPILYTRYQQLDKRLIEASMSLGASSFQTFYKIVLPFLKPGMIATALLVFILSFDDFILSYFTAGTNVQTLSLYLLSMLRTGISPIVNALSIFVLLLSSLLILCFFSPKIRNKAF
jgi:spermidine/putrescine transport system permease protein